MRPLLSIVLLLLLASAAWAEEVNIVLSPGGWGVFDGDENRVVATASRGDSGECRWQADTTREHHYTFRRENFDPIDVTLRWNAPLSRWCYGDKVLASKYPFTFSKTIRVNCSPPDAVLYRIVAAGRLKASDREVSTDQYVTQGGVRWRATPLSRTADGRQIIPNAYNPGEFYLKAARFNQTSLGFEEGQLDRPGDLFPKDTVRMAPTYGPFSYWQFNVGAPIVLGLVLAALAVVVPRTRRQKQQMLRDATIGKQVGTLSSLTLSRTGELPPLLGKHLRTERGEEYVVLSLLGQGGMGAVFEAAPTTLERKAEEHCAIKVVLHEPSEDSEYLNRFQREIQICSQLSHPGIVKVLDWGTYEPPESDVSLPFMVMELVAGRDLGKIIKESKGAGLPIPQVVGWTVEILRALRTAHAGTTHLGGIVHRDLKPDNIMLTSHGHIKIMDFGVARKMGSNSLTRTAAVIGTPYYMSPEHMHAKDVTPASDIYSLGVILYEMLSGRRPYDAPDAMVLLAKMLMSDPDPLQSLRPEIPENLGRIVEKMMARDEGLRYASADAVLVDLMPLVESGFGQ